MTSAGKAALLRETPHRTVFLQETPGRAPLVVKRFRHGNPLQFLLDRLRAGRERRHLIALRARGLLVPDPVSLRRSGRGWELALACIPGARSLEEVLATADAATKALFARRAGEALARLHSAGAVHGDPHPRNALVDREGRLWIVDLQKARMRKQLTAEALRDELITGCARVRETWSASMRCRFYLAWQKALGNDLRAPLGPRSEEVERIETHARLVRREHAKRSAQRFLRDSGAAFALTVDGAQVHVRRGEDATAAREWAKHIREAWDGEVVELPRADGSRLRALVRVASSPGSLEDVWIASARLFLHRVPVAAPVLHLLAARRACAAFELPAGAMKLDPSGAAKPSAELAQELGHLLGSLHDRGIALPRLEDDAGILQTSTGEVLLAPPRTLTPVDVGLSGKQARRGDRREVASFVPGHELRFLQAYSNAWRGTAAERLRIREELLHERGDA